MVATLIAQASICLCCFTKSHGCPIRTKSSVERMSDLYGVGDYVYFDTAPTAPFLIGKIGGFIKTCEGSVEADVQRFFRRRDLPDEMIVLAEKNICDLEEDRNNQGNLQKLSIIQRHQVKQRELFLSNKMQKLLATQIRGKCQVSLLIDTESFASYLQKDDMFFYSLLYEPVCNHLSPVSNQVRVGLRYQAEIPSLRKHDDRHDLHDLATPAWNPNNQLTDLQVDQFLLLCRSVGTFARAVDCDSAGRSPLLLASAASASRDVTLSHAMNILHRSNYDIAQSIDSLVPSGCPLLCRDEMEEWTASESRIFEQALAMHDKDFCKIRENMLPWKTLTNIIEYYYMWKTSERYLDHKKRKLSAKESKVKKVCIPSDMACRGFRNERDVNPANMWTGHVECAVLCESCNVTFTGQWFAWGRENSKLCCDCWSYWKKYGGLKTLSGVNASETMGESPHRSYLCRFPTCLLNFNSKLGLARHYLREHGMDLRCIMSPRNTYRKQSPFHLLTTPMSRISRRFCYHIVRTRQAARCPFKVINMALVKQTCLNQITGKSKIELRKLFVNSKKDRDTIANIVSRLHSFHSM